MMKQPSFLAYSPCILRNMLYLIASLLVIAVANAEEFPSARVFLQKTSLTEPVVESREFEISYVLFNTGELPATQVEVTDRYDPDSFAIIGESSDDGSVAYEVESILPGAQYQFNLTVVPKLSGMYESTRARFRYLSEDPEDEELEPEERQGSSSSMGKVKIISNAEFEKSISYHILEWCVCLGLVLVAVAIPYSRMKAANAAVSLQAKKSK